MHIKPDKTATLQRLAAAVTNDMQQVLNSDRKLLSLQNHTKTSKHRRLRHLFVGKYIMHLAGSCSNPLHTSDICTLYQQAMLNKH